MSKYLISDRMWAINEALELKTNDLKKGDRIRLRNGWYATIADNRKGNTRIATVEGFYTETGSVYSHDIQYKVDEKAETLFPICHTKAQADLKKQVDEIF